MNILIVGAGIIGAICGWAFSEGGHDVTHWVRRGKTARWMVGIPIDMLDSRKGYKKQYVDIPGHAFFDGRWIQAYTM